MSKIECKYKFHDAEKFDGKPYCTLQNELCEDLSFACDTNCQVFEDYKQLHRYKQAINEIKTMVDVIMQTNKIYPLQKKLSLIVRKCEDVNGKN